MLRVYEQSAFIKGILCFKYFFFNEKETFCFIFFRFTALLQYTLQYTYHKWLQINRLVAILFF